MRYLIRFDENLVEIIRFFNNIKSAMSCNQSILAMVILRRSKIRKIA